jgi:hypothetical protein
MVHLMRFTQGLVRRGDADAGAWPCACVVHLSCSRIAASRVTRPYAHSSPAHPPAFPCHQIARLCARTQVSSHGRTTHT